MMKKWTALLLAALLGLAACLPIAAEASFHKETQEESQPQEPQEPQATQEPAQENGKTSLQIATVAPVTPKITLDGAKKEKDVWRCEAADSLQKLRFYWSGEDAASYEIVIRDSENKPVATQQLSSPEWRFPAGDWADGEVYGLTVRALNDSGSEVYSVSTFFQITLREPAPETDEPTAAPTAAPTADDSDDSGKTDLRADNPTPTPKPTDQAGSTGKPTATPSKTATVKPTATKKHSSGGSSGGSGKSSSKATATPTPTPSPSPSPSPTPTATPEVTPADSGLDALPDRPLLSLTVAKKTLDITLDDGGGAFTAKVKDGILRLTPSKDASEWRVSQEAITILSNAGVTALELVIGDVMYTIIPQVSEVILDEEESAVVQDALPNIVWLVNEEGLFWQYGDLLMLWSLPEPIVMG